MNDRANILGLGTLVLGAVIALGNFGLTMVASAPTGAMTSAVAPVRVERVAPVTQPEADAVELDPVREDDGSTRDRKASSAAGHGRRTRGARP